MRRDIQAQKVYTTAAVCFIIFAAVIIIAACLTGQSEFWYSAYNMRLLYGDDYTAFKLFGGLHLIELIITLAISFIAYKLCRRADEETQRRVLVILSCLIAAEELLKDAVMYLTGQFQWDHLPFHICGINIFICLWYAFFRNSFAGEFLYALGLSGAWVALLTTSWQACPLLNFSHLHSVLFHMMLAVFCILVIAVGHRPHIWNIWKVLVVLLCASIPAQVFNHAVDTNFLFLQRTENNPILELIKSVCGRFYPLGLVVFACVGMLIMYAPWIVTDVRAYVKRKSESGECIS